MNDAYRLVVFDVAGTTIFEGDLVITTMGVTLERAGIVVSHAQIRAVMGMPKRLALARLVSAARADAPDRLRDIEYIYEDFVERLRSAYRTNRAVRPVDGAADTFAILREAGVKVALDTGFDRLTLDLLLDRVGWTPGPLDCTVASDEVPDGRPGPGQIRRAMALTRVSEARAVVKVGDTPADVLSGVAAQCGLVIGVSYGTHTAAQLLKHRPSMVIDELTELLPLVIAPLLRG
jgi:phosphonatase-like hydrolase